MSNFYPLEFLAAAKNNFKWVNILIVYWFIRLPLAGLSKQKEDVDIIGN